MKPGMSRARWKKVVEDIAALHYAPGRQIEVSDGTTEVDVDSRHFMDVRISDEGGGLFAYIRLPLLELRGLPTGEVVEYIDRNLRRVTKEFDARLRARAGEP